MAFDAAIICIKNETPSSMKKKVLGALNQVLNGYHLQISKQVSEKEYTDNTSSREINKYIRVRKAVLDAQEKEAYDLIKVGTDRYTAFECFASMKYAFFSISSIIIRNSDNAALDAEYALVWFSFHSKLYRVFPEFKKISYQVAELLSAKTNNEVCVLSATTMSRSADNFALYMKGKKRFAEDGRNALTSIRDRYGLDINALIANVEMNVAIYYAPKDIVEVQKHITKQQQRHQQFMQNLQNEAIQDKETHENMIQRFTAENDEILRSLTEELERTKLAFKMEPIGDILFIKIDDYISKQDPQLLNELSFG